MVSEKYNFISESEKNFLLNTLEDKIRDEIITDDNFYIWKEISVDDRCSGHPIFISIMNRTISFAQEKFGQNLKLHYFGFAIQKRGFDYHADSVWPELSEDRFLGIPETNKNNYINYSGIWVPNPLPTRKFTTVLYLNDDIVGGETHFPTLDVLVKPVKNKVVGFGCDEKFVHGVMPTTSGIRKTFICWFE